MPFISTELVTDTTLRELYNFLSETEIKLLLVDVQKIGNIVSRDNDKSYLNILINLFFRYRFNPIDLDKASDRPLYYLGLGLGLDNEFQIISEQNKDNKDIELVKFDKMVIDNDFEKNIRTRPV